MYRYLQFTYEFLRLLNTSHTVYRLILKPPTETPEPQCPYSLRSYRAQLGNTLNIHIEKWPESSKHWKHYFFPRQFFLLHWHQFERMAKNIPEPEKYISLKTFWQRFWGFVNTRAGFFWAWHLTEFAVMNLFLKLFYNGGSLLHPTSCSWYISHFNVGSQPDWYQACVANTNILQVFWVKSQNKDQASIAGMGRRCACVPTRVLNWFN